MSTLGSPSCAELRLALGVYILGSIDPAERAMVDRHLALCPSCRNEVAGLAGIPGLLGRLAEAEVTALADPPAADDRLLGRILTAAAAAHRRNTLRGRLLAAAAAVILLAAGAGTGAALVAGRDTPTPPGAVRLTSAAGPVSVSAALTPKAWGTSVDLRLSGVPGGHRCRLVAVSRNGTTDVAASYLSTASGRANVTGATAMKIAEISALRIVDTDGRTLVTLPR